MKRLFVKEDKWINGVLIIKKETVEQVASDFIFINEMLGNDEDDLVALTDAARISVHAAAIQIPVTTTEKIWKKLKKSGKDLKLIATSEKKAEKPMTMAVALV